MWTKNYKNLIKATVTCQNSGYVGESSHSFTGSYLFNFKDHKGVVREISTNNNDTSTSRYVRTLCGFVSRTLAQNDTFYASKLELTTLQSEPANWADENRIYIAYGSSDTAETEMDYTLGSVITDVTTNYVARNATLNENGTFTLEYQHVITANADITIKEIGLFIPGYYASTNSYSKNVVHMLVNRIVLDEPISVAAGDVANVTFSVTTPTITID